MSNTPEGGRWTRGASRLLTLGGGVILGTVLALLLAAGFIRGRGESGLGSWLWSKLSGSPSEINVSQPTVVRQIQQLKRLETVVYTLDKVVTAERGSPYLPDFLVGERLLLIAHGEVIGGVDLSKLRPEDVVVRDRLVRLRLPPPEVFSTRLDNSNTRIYSRDTGLLSRVDRDLETEVRRVAERQLHEAALQDGILEMAGKNARAALTSLLRGFGFQQVEIN
jgi:Protein of unknown function (DUF4230)